MQISWIDPENLNALLARITPAGGVSAPAAVEEVPPELPPEDFGLFVTPDSSMDAPQSVEVQPDAASAPVIHSDEDLDSEEVDADAHEPPLHNPDAALPLSRIRDRLRSIRQRAFDAGILTRLPESEPANCPEDAPASRRDVVSEAGQREAPTGVVATGTRRERLASFAAWARVQLHEQGGHVVIMDDGGELLWGGEGNAALVMSTMMACGAAIRTSAASACGVNTVIRQALASGNFLTVIPVAFESGMLHIAVAAPSALPDELAVRLSAGLASSMRGISD